MRRLDVSVAMCTYNGEKYLEEQLDSIAAQTVQPAELIVCDDRSSDATPDLVRRFAMKARFPVRLAVNEQNLGSTKNFDKAISLCRHDIISLSDQDDVWYPDKLEKAVRAFRNYPDAGLVFFDADIVDERLQPLGYTLWESLEFSRDLKRDFMERNYLKVLLNRTVVTGAAMAFQSGYRAILQPIPNFWFHDAWISLVLAAYADLVYVDEPVMKYRQHSRQQVGAPTGRSMSLAKSKFRNRREQWRNESRFLSEVSRRLAQQRAGRRATDESVAQIAEKAAHLERRASMPDNRLLRIPAIARELTSGRYSRFSKGWVSAAKDLVI